MKHVFIGPNDVSIEILYQGFKNGKDTELILMTDFVRKAAKVLTMLGATASGKVDFLLRPHYKSIIGKCIEQKNWNEGFCFIVYGRIYESYGMSLVRYLRETFTECKIVVYLGDMVTRHKFNVNDLKKAVDKVVSFDIKDAKSYELGWCLEPFSSNAQIPIKSGKKNVQWDVTFVGAAKNRYGKIIKMYEILKEAGLVCDFHITGVKPKDRLYKEEIGYEYMDFKTLLEHVNCSNCIAEIVQDGGMSPTTRYSEAMLYGKNLLTDCKFFKDQKNRTDNIFYFDEVSELKNWDLTRLKVENPIETLQYVKRLSIEEMVKTIDDMLS